MTQGTSNASSSTHNGTEEEEVQTPKDINDDCPKLTEEQLQQSTSELYKAKHLPSGKRKNDSSNFTGKYRHVSSF